MLIDSRPSIVDRQIVRSDPVSFDFSLLSSGPKLQPCSASSSDIKDHSPWTIFLFCKIKVWNWSSRWAVNFQYACSILFNTGSARRVIDDINTQNSKIAFHINCLHDDGQQHHLLNISREFFGRVSFVTRILLSYQRRWGMNFFSRESATPWQAALHWFSITLFLSLKS